MTLPLKHITTTALLVSLLGLGAILVVPIPEGETDYSHVLYDRQGELLAAQIASDQQWRFPINEPLPDQLSTCIRYYEDEYFHWHPGINPASVLKAVWVNVKEGRIVRGASTIPMQVMRIYRGNRPRTLWQKIIESLGALKLELFHSKEEILRIWAERAPFGGNTVGASAAAWRYFQRELDNLSLAEYATLAVLPNSPATVHLSRNTALLKQRRDFLLKKLWSKGLISRLDFTLSVAEDVPEFQSDPPLTAWHMLQLCKQQTHVTYEFQSTLDLHLQKRVQSIVDEFSALYQRDGIRNAAALVIDNQRNEVLAYVGNSAGEEGTARYVDCIRAARSYGSLLKPVLYAHSLDRGYFLPRELIKDIPTNVQGFAPKNFDRDFRGWVKFDEMVSQSLNVPAVRTLNYVGLPSFHSLLKHQLSLEHIHPDPHHHGLSLILGGAEATMWELARIYKGLALNMEKGEAPYRDIQYLLNSKSSYPENAFSFYRVAVDHTLRAMASVERPVEEQQFIKYGGSRISWKTGTSYGHRDAWAIGTSPEYTVAVWVGNEEGDGVYDLTGVRKAAPILFRVFGSLPNTSDFQKVHSGKKIRYCSETGRLAGSLCSDVAMISAAPRFHHLRQCRQHAVHIGKASSRSRRDTVLSLDPVANYYYEAFHGHPISRQGDNLSSKRSTDRLRIVYPTDNRVVFLPKKLDQQTSQVEVSAHSTAARDKIFWYLNGDFHSSTTMSHVLNLELQVGTHQLYIVNHQGQEDEVRFEVVRRSEP